MSGPAQEQPQGEPDALRRLAQHLLDVADGIASSAAVLSAVRADLADAVWQGAAAAAFEPYLEELPARFDRIAASYRAAGRALADYAPRLARAQTDAAASFRAASSALQRLSATAQEARESRDDSAADRVARAEARVAEQRRDEVVRHWRRDAASCAEALLDAAALAEAAGAGPAGSATSTRADAAAVGEVALSVVSGVAALVSGVCSLVAFAWAGRGGGSDLRSDLDAAADEGVLSGRAGSQSGQLMARALEVSADELATAGRVVVVDVKPEGGSAPRP